MSTATELIATSVEKSEITTIEEKSEIATIEEKSEIATSEEKSEIATSEEKSEIATSEEKSEIVNNFAFGKPFEGFPAPSRLNLFKVPSPLDSGNYSGVLTGRSMAFEFKVGDELFNSVLIEIELDNGTQFVPCADGNLIAKFRKGMTLNFEASEPTRGKNGRLYTTIKSMEIA